MTSVIAVLQVQLRNHLQTFVFLRIRTFTFFSMFHGAVGSGWLQSHYHQVRNSMMPTTIDLLTVLSRSAIVHKFCFPITGAHLTQLNHFHPQ